MVNAAPLIRKTRFPRQLSAFAVVGTNMITFAVMVAILFVLCLVFIPASRDVAWLSLPLAVLIGCLAAGLVLARRDARTCSSATWSRSSARCSCRGSS